MAISQQVLAIVVLAMSVVGTSACQRDSPDLSAAPAPSTTPSATPTESGASQALAAYRAMQSASDRALSDPDHPSAEVVRYMAEPLRTSTVRILDSLRSAGVVFVGTLPSYAPTVRSVDLTASPPRVVLADCPRVPADWHVIYVKTRKSAEGPGTDLRARAVVATATRSAGRWLVTQVVRTEAKPC